MRIHLLPRGSWVVLYVAVVGCDPSDPATIEVAAKDQVAAPITAGATVMPCSETVRARVVAIDQVYDYNRFGAFNPAGLLYALRRDVVAQTGSAAGPGNAQLRPDKRPRPLVLRVNVGQCLEVELANWLAAVPPDEGPTTRSVSFHVNGLHYTSINDDGAAVGNNPSSLVRPGETRTYRFFVDKEGTFLFHGLGALVGGEAVGGSTVLGLFGAVNVEPSGATWYRSQVSAADLERATVGRNPDGTPRLDYEVLDDQGVPVLRMLDAGGEIVHGDITAIIAGYTDTELDSPSSAKGHAFREFTSGFHDELEVEQAFPELKAREDLASIADGFGINYGTDAFGPRLLANRRRIGPAADCLECKYEEFFLQSWTGGDPALLVERDSAGRPSRVPYVDDPSNVTHSYLGDPVRFRNLHAGPKETHVFHLHGHQWQVTPQSDRSMYTDSQSIAPGAAFTYDINYGGGGNRNVSPGDAIYHCHLYPHFAQGMWALWRNHDVFEDGTAGRNLPDTEIPGGVPTPAIVPIPGFPLAPMPTTTPTLVVLEDGSTVTRPPMPGYPFYLAGRAGHRAPQPPLDVLHDGGLQRHVFRDGPDDAASVVRQRRGEFDVEIHRANIKLLPAAGTVSERAAMDFHAGLFPGATPAASRYGWAGATYPSFTAAGDAARFFVNGRPPQPGAPFAEPCAPGSPMRVYKAAYVQQDLPLNRFGWHDPQGRFLVLNEDVAATRSGQRRIEPFFFRANSGECIEFQATNLMPQNLEGDDFQVFSPTDTVGQHIHLVKFDVTSSDGSGNGWNYEDGTLATEEVRERIAAANALGGAFSDAEDSEATGTRLLLEPRANPYFPDEPAGTQTTVQRWWSDPLIDRVGNDRTLRTVFTHDHFGPSSHQQHGLYGALVIEPKDSRWLDNATGAPLGGRDDGGPTSYAAVIDAGSDSFREFNLAFADFALAYDAFGDPVNPPNRIELPLPLGVGRGFRVLQEAVSDHDPGTMLINYQNEPVPLRVAQRLARDDFRLLAGARGELGQAFSSITHGDPATPLLEAYDGDRVQFRLIQGAQEEQHVFKMHGQVWHREPGDTSTAYINAQPIGISEHFEFVRSDGAPGRKVRRRGTNEYVNDYLYGSAPTEDVWNGMWGIFRSHAVLTPRLFEMSQNPRPRQYRPVAGLTCPASARRRSYRVHAVNARTTLPGGRLVYNEQFDLYDPDAVLLVRAEHLSAVRSGSRTPEPLFMRVAAGECLEVTVTNDLPAVFASTPNFAILTPLSGGFNINQVPRIGTVGLHVEKLLYDPDTNDGPNVGVNTAQTIPGRKSGSTTSASRVYRWYAGTYDPARGLIPVELGASNLVDMGNVVQHPLHGAVGMVIVEPAGAVWREDGDTAAQAQVTYRNRDGVQGFRELALVVQTEVALHSDDPRFRDLDPVSGSALRPMSDDIADAGFKAINYRTEPLWARLGLPPIRDADVLDALTVDRLLSSASYGDPETPIFKVKAGERFRVRVGYPSGRSRQGSFTLHGAAWPRDPHAPSGDATVIDSSAAYGSLGSQGPLAAGMSFDLVPRFGAGGPMSVRGDYLYREQSSFGFFNGLWGLMRVEAP